MIETLSEKKEVGVKLLRNDLHNYQQEFWSIQAGLSNFSWHDVAQSIKMGICGKE